jgi:LacI family transcriptional regulator
VKRAGRDVGIVDVAAAAGVSVGTVSNVLNHPERVATATKQRVLTAADELGFVRNESARLLRAGRSRVIGLVVLDVANPFFTDVARGAEEEASRRGYSMMLCNSDDSRDKEQRYVELLEEQRVHGVLITPTEEAGRQLAAVRKRGTPVVFVDRAADVKDACSVAVDDVQGGALVMAHLQDQLHRWVAFVGGPFTLAQVRDRHEGFTQDAGGTTVTRYETEGLNLAQGRSVGQLIAALPRRQRPTAVFCANDLLALGMLQSFVQGGVRVPQDVAIVGYDDIEFAAAAAVPLTSVRQPRERLGRTAVELLFAEGESDHTHRRLSFEPFLVVRESSSLRRRQPPARS